jgi:hypothetical protein
MVSRVVFDTCAPEARTLVFFLKNSPIFRLGVYTPIRRLSRCRPAAALTAYPWPGNIREVQNLIERAMILSRGPVLEVPLAELQSSPDAATAQPTPRRSRPSSANPSCGCCAPRSAMHDASQQAAQARHCTLPRVTARGHLTVYGQPLHWPCRPYFVAFPRNSCAPAGPTRMGTGIALLVDRPGGRAIRTSTLTEIPRRHGSSRVPAHAGVG